MNNQIRIKTIIATCLLFFLIPLFCLGEGFDPESILQDKELKEQLKKLNSKQKADGAFMYMAKNLLKLKGYFDFCEDLWGDGAFVKQVDVIMDVPVQKWVSVGWGRYEIENVRKLVSQNKRNSIFQVFKAHGKSLADAMALYSIARDIYGIYQGKKGAELKAIIGTYTFVQGYILRELGIGISNVAMAGAQVVTFSLNIFINDLQGRYEDYWWNAYLQYMEGKYQDKDGWFQLAVNQGEAGLKGRLYEFWANADQNANEYYQPKEHRIISRSVSAESEYKSKFAAYYYSKFIYEPFLRRKLEEKAVAEEYEKKKLVMTYYRQLMAVAKQIDLIRRAIKDADQIAEDEKNDTLTIIPAQKTIKIGETVTFKVLAKQKGEYENVTAKSLASKSFTGVTAGTFNVIAKYNDKTAVASVTVEKKEGKDEADLEEVIEELKEDSEEDPCEEDVEFLMGEFKALQSNIERIFSHFSAAAAKFYQEINSRRSDICTNRMMAFAYYQAKRMAGDVSSMISEARDLHEKIIIISAACKLKTTKATVKNLLYAFNDIGPITNSVSRTLAAMQGKLSELSCDEKEISRHGEQVTAQGDIDPTFLQQGGAGTEIQNDSVDNTGEGLQDEANYQTDLLILVWDSGSAKDDVFSVTLSGYGPLGTTPSGSRKVFAKDKMKPGPYSVSITTIKTEVGAGTWSVKVSYKGKVLVPATSGTNSGAVSFVIPPEEN